MRWLLTIIMTYLIVLLQTTIGKMFTFERFAIGPFGPDFMAIFVVFVTLFARTQVDALMVAWIAGMMVDLTTAGGAGLATRVGVMPLCYMLGAWVVFNLREGLYRDRFLPQMMVAGIFCLISHMVWIIIQSIFGSVGWGVFGRLIGQVLLSSIYTGLFAPLLCFVLMFTRGFFMGGHGQRGRGRSRR